MTSSRIGRLVARTTFAALSVSCLGLVAGTTVATSAASAVGFPTGRSDDPAVGQAVAALDALGSANDVAYLDDLTALAQTIAPRAEVDPARLLAAWAMATPTEMTVVLSALTQLGVSYHYATSEPGVSFDCSGLVRWAWSQAGISLPTNSSAIIRSMDNTPLDQIEPGDVLWYPGHVMIALGVDDAYVHAVGRGKPLEVHSMYSKRHNRIKVIDPAG